MQNPGWVVAGTDLPMMDDVIAVNSAGWDAVIKLIYIKNDEFKKVDSFTVGNIFISK